jgi:hypothetical protein
MARKDSAASLLAWFMLLAGGVSLFACVFLPPWLEVRALREEHAAARMRVDQLEVRLARATKQIEHMQNDPAYLERLAHKEFGIEPPGVEVIPVEIRESASASAPADPASEAPVEKLAVDLEQATHTSPLVSVFVLDQTRPIVMAMSGVLVIIALVLLNRARST